MASGATRPPRIVPCGMISCSKGTTAIIALSGGSPRQHKALRCSTAPTPASPEARRKCRLIRHSPDDPEIGQ